MVSGTFTTPYDGFGGQYGNYHDPTTGWFLMGHRFYAAGQARFVNRDPIGYGGGINVYGYSDDDPMNGADPSGFDDGNGETGPEQINLSPTTSWGGEWAGDGQQGVDDMKPEFAPGSPQRQEISGLANAILPPVALAGSIMGCDLIGGTPVHGLNWVLLGLSAIPAIGPDGKAADKAIEWLPGELANKSARESAEALQQALIKAAKGLIGKHGIKRVDVPNPANLFEPGRLPHIEGDGWSVNIDGSWHDAGTKISGIPMKAYNALRDIGWPLPPR